MRRIPDQFETTRETQYLDATTSEANLNSQSRFNLWISDQISSLNRRMCSAEREVSYLMCNNVSSIKNDNLESFSTKLMSLTKNVSELREFMTKMPQTESVMSPHDNNIQSGDQNILNEETSSKLHVDYSSPLRDSIVTPPTVLSPRVINFEDSRKPNENYHMSSQNKIDPTYALRVDSAKDLDEVICYLFDEDLMPSTIVVNYGDITLTRLQISSLAPCKWINGSVIDAIAYICWREAKDLDNDTPHWILPAMFSNLALEEGYPDEKIQKIVFGLKRRYTGPPSSCKMITIPINDRKSHWFIATVDIINQKVTVVDTLDAMGKNSWRCSLVEKLILRLELLVEQWDVGHTKHREWGKFKVQYHHSMPQQNNNYDCGLYVCLMMICPKACSRLLTEEEAVTARIRLAAKMYYFTDNCVKKGIKVDLLLSYYSAEHILPNVDIANLTPEYIIEIFLELINVDSEVSGGKEPKLYVRTLSGPESQYTAFNNDLIATIDEYIDMKKKRISFMVDMESHENEGKLEG